MSYQNLILYSAVLPDYTKKDKKDKKWNSAIDANNPDNFKKNNGNDDEEVVVKKR
ncbi:hypothetical protein [uncultured Bacteroides sp.]|uniref:hypothetical protein n=1 Tax=uncultured Bacteroides sp. TaxID=162156 RepID=UPI002AAB757F|nr:hypothetical protein [uncultured Bacteroides sp.]